MTRSNKMPPDFQKRVSDGMKLHWIQRRKDQAQRAKEEQEALKCPLCYEREFEFCGQICPKCKKGG